MKRKTRIALIAILLSLTVLLTACSSKSSVANDMATEEAYSTDYAMPAAAPAAMMEAGYGMSTAAQSAPMEITEQLDGGVRKIIYNADMGITADDPAAALNAIMEKAKALGGYVADSYTTTDELGAYRCTASLKVPAEQLETLVAAVGTLGKVDSYQLSSDDISRDYYDIEARLKSAKAEEEQLTLILADCKTVEEVLAVRESLAAVRADIESYQGQINLWDNLVSYATLQLSVRRTQRAAVEGDKEPIAIWKASDVFKKMKLGFTNSARFVVNAVGAIGIFLAYAVLPCAAVAAIVIGVVALNRKTKPAREKRREKRRADREARRAQKLQKKLEKKNE